MAPIPTGGFLTRVTSVDRSSQPSEEDAFWPEDWLTASETIRLVRTTTLSGTSHITIATRAHAGLIRSRADLLVIGKESRPNVSIPPEFWWATGHEALTQNWETGDFDTWIDRKLHLRAFGVRFHREDVRQMIPAAFLANPAPKAEPRNPGGRRMSELWPEWVAELVAHVHESGIPAGSGTQGADELIATIDGGLAERGLEAPSRSTVQETVTAVLRRLRTL